MDVGSTAPNLLQHIYAVGESMGDALDSDDLDLFFALTAERGTLLEGLNAYEHPAQICPNWQQLAKALEDQHQRITGALAVHDGRLSGDLESIERYKGARQSYATPQMRNRIMHEDVRG